MSRPEAVNLLLQKRPGTFLLRKGENGVHVVSRRVNKDDAKTPYKKDQVIHMKISKKKNRGTTYFWFRS